MDSEPELEHRRADLTMTIRPDMRKYTIMDILIKFEFVSLKQTGTRAEQPRTLTADELAALPSVARAMDEAKKQVREYAEAINKRHADLLLRKFAVVSLGFERLCLAEISLRFGPSRL